MARKRRPGGSVREASIHEVEEIPVDEQVRLIEQSGVLGLEELDDSDAELLPLDEQERSPTKEYSLFEEIFDSVILLIPFTCLYIGMDVMIKQQYAQHPSVNEELGQLINALPILALFIFYTNRYKNTTSLQIGMAFASAAAGCRMIYLVNKESWNTVIRQCPPLGVIWVYSVVQLHLGYACTALLVVYAYVRYNALKIIF